MTDVANPKRTSPDQLLPYHKKISAEGKAQMICFISYTYMVLKRTVRFSSYSPVFSFLVLPISLTEKIAIITAITTTDRNVAETLSIK